MTEEDGKIDPSGEDATEIAIGVMTVEVDTDVTVESITETEEIDTK